MDKCPHCGSKKIEHIGSNPIKEVDEENRMFVITGYTKLYGCNNCDKEIESDEKEE